jgi:intracellular septation protein A
MTTGETIAALPTENAVPSPAPAGIRRGASWSLISLLGDFVVPVVAYYALRAAGASVWVALVVPSILTGLFAVVRWIRERRIDVLGLGVVVVLVASVAISYVSGSPRFLLAKGAVFTAAIGVVFLGSLLLRRPFGFSFARDLIERTTLKTADWDEVWDREPQFRRAWRVITVAWGVATLLDAVVLVYMAYQLPIDSVPALASMLRIVTFVVLQILTNGYLMYAGVWRSIGLDPRTILRRGAHRPSRPTS